MLSTVLAQVGAFLAVRCAAPEIAGRYKPAGALLRSGGLAARSLCRFEVRIGINQRTVQSDENYTPSEALRR